MTHATTEEDDDGFGWSDAWTHAVSDDDTTDQEGWTDYLGDVVAARLGGVRIGIDTRTGSLYWSIGDGWSGDENLVSRARSSSLDGKTVGEIMLELAAGGYVPSSVWLLMGEHDTYG